MPVGVSHRFRYSIVHLVVEKRFRDAGGERLSHREVRIVAFAAYSAVIEGGRRDHRKFHANPGVSPQATLDWLGVRVARYGVPAGVVLQQAAVGDIVLVGTGVPCAGR